MSYLYQAFGLNIRAEMEIPMLQSGGDGADLSVRFGQVSGCSEEILFENEEYQISAHEFLFRVSGVGEFFVASGDRIIVNPAEKSPKYESSEIYVYLLGTVMGALLYQRGHICMHGSAVKIGGAAVIITGDSGAGKSTVSSALNSLGYPFLTDDVALVKNSGGKIFVYPSYPQKKLWIDALNINNISMLAGNRECYKIRECEEKYAVSYPDLFWNTPLELAHIYNLTVCDTDSVKMSEISGIRRINLLTANTYRSFLIRYLGSVEKYFDLCTVIEESVRMYDIVRPRGFKAQDTIAGLIIEIAKS